MVNEYNVSSGNNRNRVAKYHVAENDSTFQKRKVSSPGSHGPSKRRAIVYTLSRVAATCRECGIMNFSTDCTGYPILVLSRHAIHHRLGRKTIFTSVSSAIASTKIKSTLSYRSGFTYSSRSQAQWPVVH